MRYFNLSNKAAVLCSLIGNTPSFVFDGDNITEEISKKRAKIEELLKERNYDVPGVNVEFYHDVTSELGQHIIKIASISCENPDIRMNSWEVRVGGIVMSIHCDGSGSMEMYCGTNWNNDRNEFVKSNHYNRKMNGKSRIVLQYNKHGDSFVATDDCNRGYMPEESQGESSRYSVEDIETRMLTGMDWLMAHIRNTPVADIDPGVFSEPKPTPMTNPLLQGMRLFTNVDSDTRHQMIDRARGNYGMGGSWRLLTLGMERPGGHPYRDLMHEGFVYCNIQMPGKEVMDNNWHYGGRDHTPVEVRLSKADNVFVVDAGIFDRMKERFFLDNSGLERMSDDDLNRMIIARGASMVHVNDYDGSFEKPVVIIGRILSVDELATVEVSKVN